MTDTPEPPLPEPANLKFLRLLVTTLTATMIVGLLIIITLIVIRYRDRSAPLPDTITLPDGATATAFTQGPDWYAVVTGDNHILIFDRSTGVLRQTIDVD
ncbi:DUF6476 family protein [Puniceibacterium sediminis]|uniref:DUF6476 family protein n=1 Tax=Puniceibacterium sediminis TaxID=1608407 RepID=UPI000B791225|nr:DUF6476 family protein [Puniceibacterium sediminis]